MPTITDWLMVIITGVYVVATVFICRANIKSAKATQAQIDESRQQFEESNRAFVTVSLEIIKSGIAVLHIQNLGKRIAEDVRVRVSKSFIDNVENKLHKEHLQTLYNSSFSLGIGQSWYICIGSHLQLKQMSTELLAINLSYRDKKSSYSDVVKIDISQFFWALLYESPLEDIRQEIKSITKAICSIDKSIKTIAKRMPEEEGKNDA